jgi:hypothetical protein
LQLIETKVYDASGNNNGRLDPGETVNLTAFLKNIGGQAFTNLSTTLSTTSPYITITDNAGAFGAIPVDSTKENYADPYVIQAAANTPNGHAALIRLIASETGFCDTFDFNLTVGTYHYLVWNPDPTPTSGQIIDSLLRTLNYNGVITTALPTRGALDMYRAIFVCLGIFPNNKVIAATSPEAQALAEYLSAGGRLYLEGGDVWYYDPLYMGGYDFNPSFGVNATSDGSSDLGPVVGQAGTFTRTMNFNYAGENIYMDNISPTGSGAFLIFNDQDNLYDCGVARDAGTFRTVGCPFELGSLVDASGASTRQALVDSIMKFFGISLVAIEAAGGQDVMPFSLEAIPNPFRDQTKILFSIGHSATQFGGVKSIEIKIYDAGGRLVKSFAPPSALSSATNLGGPSALTWDGTDQTGRRVPSGVYFIHCQADAKRRVQKVIVAR